MANPNGNIKNLDPVRTKEEAKKRGKNGGKASGKARRKKASLMKCAQRVLESDVPKELKGQLSKMVGEVEDENDTLFTMAVASMVKESIKGNAKAFHELSAIVQNLEDVYIDDEDDEDELSKALREYAESL